eukprot:evm.model.NODE_41696_length_13227_cov_36.716339.4
MAEDAISVKIKTLKGGGEKSVDLKLTAESTVGQLKVCGYARGGRGRGGGSRV